MKIHTRLVTALAVIALVLSSVGGAAASPPRVVADAATATPVARATPVATGAPTAATTATPPSFTQRQVLTAPDPDATYAEAVAIDGQTMAIGNRLAGGLDFASLDFSGSVDIWTQAGGTWSRQATLKASPVVRDATFGTSVAISGNTLVVGASMDHSPDQVPAWPGGAYVFVRAANGTWSQQAHLVSPNPTANGDFGRSVAIEGDTIVVGATHEDAGAVKVSGAAYVFTRTGATWTQQARLLAATPKYCEEFGASVAISGNRVLVGAPERGWDGIHPTPGGAVDVFVRTGTSWALEQRLRAPNGEFGDGFGCSLALVGTTMLIGAPGESSGATGNNGDQTDNTSGGSGAVYAFEKAAGAAWTLSAFIKAANNEAGAGFGASLSLDANTAVIGAPRESSSWGAAHVITRSGPGTAWSELQGLALREFAGAMFGYAVAVDGDTIVAGAPNDMADLPWHFGRAAIYTRPGPTTTVVTSTFSPSPPETPIAFVAMVSPVTATGTVTFTENLGKVIGTVPVDMGIAAISTSALWLGLHMVTATYNGSADFLASSSQPFEQSVVRPAIASTALAAVGIAGPARGDAARAPMIAGSLTYTGVRAWALPGSTAEAVTSSAGVRVGAGDITDARVTFTASPILSDGPDRTCTAAVGRATGADGGEQTGSASCSWSAGLGSAQIGAYRVTASLAVDGAEGVSADPATVLVWHRVRDVSVKTAAWLAPGAAAGRYAGSSARVEANVRFIRGRVVPGAMVQVTLRQGHTTYRFQARSLSAMTAFPAIGYAVLVGTGTGTRSVDGHPGTVRSLGRGFTVEVRLFAPTGTAAPVAGITVWDAKGGLVASGNWATDPVTRTTLVAVARGSIRIR